jgi:arginase
MGLIRSDIDALSSGDIAIVGIPFDENSSFLQGPANAPQLIIDAVESDSANYFTEHLIDLDQHPKVKWVGNLELDSYFSIEQSIDHILGKGAIPFSLGGDHSITYPILKSIAKAHQSVSILHFDAHGDLYNELDGNKFSHACPFARIMEDGLAKHLTQVGIRTMTQHQKEQAERFKVNVIQMKDWQPGLDLHLDGPVYVTFDIDVLDPAFAPGVSHHEPGGFTTREALSMIQKLQLDIIGCDLVEYNPTRDLNGVTGMVVAKLLKEMLAHLL